MLAHIVSLMKNIVVAGSHGKTTTTSLVTSIFQKTKIDPTIINGGVINSIKNSAKLGKVIGQFWRQTSLMGALFIFLLLIQL